MCFATSTLLAFAIPRKQQAAKLPVDCLAKIEQIRSIKILNKIKQFSDVK
jgi:mRNA-degrading endonuclease toxin of MazEF toxin-antitoxin module